METRQPWYEELFDSGDYVRFWLGGKDAPRIPPEHTAREVEFVVEKLDLSPGAHLLDLCCGHGRHSVPLAERGYVVTGIDRSPLHLSMARDLAARSGVEIEFIEADMREIPRALDGKVDAVISIFSSFGYFDSDAEEQRVLSGIARALKPGGSFLIDTINRDGLMRRFRPKDWEAYGDTLLLTERRFDFVEGRNHETMTVLEPDGSRRTTGFSVRVYTLNELIAMLNQAGLAFQKAWGDFGGSEMGIDSRRLIVLTEKV